MVVSRRGVLCAGVAGAGVLALGGGARAVAAPAADEFAKIVSAYRALQVGKHRRSPERDQAVRALDEVAAGYDAAMNVGADQLWADLPVRAGSEFFPKMYYRLRTIAVDWATPGSALSAKPGTAARIRTALDTLYRLQYNENTSEIGNWYVYEIGVPYWLLQTVVALGGELPAADRERLLRPVLRFVGDPNRRTSNPRVVETGANRADKALITVVSGALAGDADRIATGVAAVTDVAGGGAASLVRRVTSGDGFHTDGSFLQHDVVPYPGHYALVLLQAVAGLAEVTAGTRWEPPADVRRAIGEAAADACAPFMFAGSMMEPVRGRFLSRQGETGHDSGHQLTAAAVLLARTAPEPIRSRLAGLAADWIDRGKWAPFLKVTDVGRFSGGLQPVGVPEVEYAQELLATRPERPPLAPVHRVFGQQDRMVHVTRDWSASLGIGSARICRYESINGMNLHGWYTGDGVLYVFLPGAEGHYSDAYWPTVDARLLPGTTTKDATPPPLESVPLTSKSFAGGARLDDGHGVHGLDFVSQDGTLTAKKSWFFTPAGVVCLGAGITDSSGAAVRTTVENRNLGERGGGRLLVDGRPSTVELGRTATVRGARWLHLECFGGYVLLGDATLSVLREDRTGTWRDVDTGANTGGTTTPYTRRYQKLVLEHGTRPQGAAYAYGVLPAASVPATILAAGAWRVRANTAAAQAIRLWDTTLLANFFEAGTVDELGVSGPASVALARSRDGWRLAVADPTQRQETIRVTVRRRTVEVPVAGALGATRTVTVPR
ncbi:polysaccharide lyase 8 family protein [Amycolatopsis anabasis]|uniref:polysaccharide lyase 8 family protein n=1 Tax=Amycolatopsis anabasis TaxID=1840409 RepID=UPI00131D53FD|nr:polysaccharide lyase 8 family protein [Amycolatopsis anabasis]